METNRVQLLSLYLVNSTQGVCACVCLRPLQNGPEWGWPIQVQVAPGAHLCLPTKHTTAYHYTYFRLFKDWMP